MEETIQADVPEMEEDEDADLIPDLIPDLQQPTNTTVF